MGLCYFEGMKTTVEISDPLMARAKKVCAEHGMSMKSLLEKALAEKLDQLDAKVPWDSKVDFSMELGLYLNENQNIEDVIDTIRQERIERTLNA